MLNAMSPLKFLNALPRLPDFSNNIFLIGETKQIKTLNICSNTSVEFRFYYYGIFCLYAGIAASYLWSGIEPFS